MIAVLAAFQRRQGLAQAVVGRVALALVLVAGHAFAGRAVAEGGGEVDGWRDRAGGGVRFVADVDGHGFGAKLRTHAVGIQVAAQPCSPAGAVCGQRRFVAEQGAGERVGNGGPDMPAKRTAPAAFPGAELVVDEQHPRRCDTQRLGAMGEHGGIGLGEFAVHRRAVDALQPESKYALPRRERRAQAPGREMSRSRTIRPLLVSTWPAGSASVPVRVAVGSTIANRVARLPGAEIEASHRCRARAATQSAGTVVHAA